MKILAFSSSRVGNSGFLETALSTINDFFGEKKMTIAFIPFASVEKDYKTFGAMVQEAFKELPYTIVVVNENEKEVIENCDAIMVGGGNTFKLLHRLYANDLLGAIQKKVKKGTPYVGWSAGANITGKTICTTNDMPIIHPKSFDALQFFPFQINPHYYSQKLEGHNGETRDQRINEFIFLNPKEKVIGLPEGTALFLKDGVLNLIGIASGVLFQSVELNKISREEVSIGYDLSYLL